MKRNSLQRSIWLAAVLLALFVYAGSAAVSYVLSIGKVQEEQERESVYVRQQMMDNVSVMFAQAEKIPLLISENKTMMEQMLADDENDAQEVASLQQIETDLYSLYRFYPHVETILISLKNNKTYLVSRALSVPLSTAQIRLLNRYQAVHHPIAADNDGLWSTTIQSPEAGTLEAQQLYKLIKS